MSGHDMSEIERVNTFWTGLDTKTWYGNDPDLDARIRSEFQDLWERAHEGGLHEWLVWPEGALAYLILTDQFPRNMFDDARAHATDGVALAAAKSAIDRKLDLRIDGMVRQFFYVPLMHSESLQDQELCIAYLKQRMPDGGKLNVPFAVKHRAVIRRFGRYPSRNAILGRQDSSEEIAYRKEGGYLG